MCYIKAKPPFSLKEIEDIIKFIKNVESRTVDAVGFSNMIQACYDFALKKKELINLSIKDIFTENQMKKFIQFGNSQVDLSAVSAAI